MAKKVTKKKASRLKKTYGAKKAKAIKKCVKKMDARKKRGEDFPREPYGFCIWREVKKNPLLMTVVANPPQEDHVRKLWSDARRINPDLSKEEFVEALEDHYNMHHNLPEKITAIDAPDGISIAVDIGKSPVVYYEPSEDSRKQADGPNLYEHETKDTRLVAGIEKNKPKKKHFFLPGTMDLKDDGWLHG